FGAGDPRLLRPRRGRRGLLLALGAIREAPAGEGSLGEAMNLVGGLAAERSLVVVVSDFRGPIDWRRGLLRVAARHATLAVEIRDPREQALADVGELVLVDPETGPHVVVDTGGPALRPRYADAAEDDRRELVALLSSAGVRHVALSTGGDCLPPLANFLSRSDRK